MIVRLNHLTDMRAQDNEVIGHSGIYSNDPEHMLSAFDQGCRFLTAQYKAGDVRTPSSRILMEPLQT